MWFCNINKYFNDNKCYKYFEWYFFKSLDGFFKGMDKYFLGFICMWWMNILNNFWNDKFLNLSFGV